MTYLVFIIGGMLALWLIWDRFWRRTSMPFSRLLTQVLLAGLVALGILLLVTGKFAGVLAVLAGLWPWVSRALRLHSLWRWFRGLQTKPTSPPPDPTAPPPPPASGRMTVDEARQILGIGPDASPDDIRAAHRRLMLNNHPDHGGSTWIASRINQARDCLLEQK